MTALRPAAKTYIAAVTLAALALAATLLLVSPRDRGTGGAVGGAIGGGVDLLPALALTTCVAFAWLFPLHFAFKTKLYADVVPVFAAVLLFEPAVAMAVAGAGTLIAHLLRRDPRDPAETLFNTALAALETGLVGLLYAAAGGQVAALDRPAGLLAAATAGAAMYLVNTLALAVVVGLQVGLPPRAWLRPALADTRVDLLAHAAQLGIALTLVFLALDHPWSLVLLAPAVAGVYATLRQHAHLRRRVEETLRGTEANLATAQRIARLGSFDWDLASGAQHWSDETYRILGFEPQTFPPVADVFLSCVPLADRSRVEAAHRDALARGTPFRLDHRVLRADGAERIVQQQGEVVADPAGRPRRLVGTILDITERKELEAQLAHRAAHDPLTGLPNRALFADRLERALAPSADPADHPLVAVIFLDLDGFKLINDSLGHDAGDALLVEVAARLRAAVRPSDTAARLGGDEFVLLLNGLAAPSAAVTIAERAVAALRQPVAVAGREVTVSASAGVACGAPGRAAAADLLRDADAALYQAKRAGKDRTVPFDPGIRAEAIHRRGLHADLRRAIGRDELRLHFQPQVDLATGRIVALEALVRWQHPTHGLVPPAGFLPLADETGLIATIDDWVLAAACRQAAAWQRLHPAAAGPRIAVNLSARQLRQPELPARVAAVLAESGLPPDSLVLELTEPALAEAAAAATLAALRALGVRLALDDFGAGPASLAALRTLDLDALKLDRSFVRDLGTDPRALAIAAAVARLAADLGMAVTAEGIETADQLVRARAAGCRTGQGHHFAPPLPSQAAGDLLARTTPFDVLPNVLPVPPAAHPARRTAPTA